MEDEHAISPFKPLSSEYLGGESKEEGQLLEAKLVSYFAFEQVVCMHDESICLLPGNPR